MYKYACSRIIRKLWGFLGLFSQSLRKNSLQSLRFSKEISFPNCLLILHTPPSWELLFGSKTYGGSHFFVKVWSESNFDHFLNERLPRKACNVIYMPVQNSDMAFQGTLHKAWIWWEIRQYQPISSTYNNWVQAWKWAVYGVSSKVLWNTTIRGTFLLYNKHGNIGIKQPSSVVQKVKLTAKYQILGCLLVGVACPLCMWRQSQTLHSFLFSCNHPMRKGFCIELVEYH